MTTRYSKWGAVTFASALSWLLFPLATAAIGPTPACASVVIDNDTTDWSAVSALATDGADITGTTYYYNGTGWSTTSSSNDVYSTNPDMMMDLETIKVCNTATQIQFYIDAYHPLFGLFEIATGDFYEFGDPDGPAEDVGMPVDFDNWMVVKMQESSGEPVYYYVLHLYVPQGDAGMLEGPTETAIYEESDGNNFASSNFDPDDDTLLVSIVPEDEEHGSGAKAINFEGGFESGPALVNADGDGLFNMTNITYGDSLRMAVLTYSNEELTTNAFMAAAHAQADAGLLDSTERSTFEIRKVGVMGVRVPKNKRHDDSALVRWSKIPGATSYTLSLRKKGTTTYESISGGKKLRQRLSGLKADTQYEIRVRAVITDKTNDEVLTTPWSARVEFTTKE